MPNQYSTMHAKCVAVDESATFITSANFTSSAQTTNVEVGVLVRDAEFAQRVVPSGAASRREGCSGD